MRHQLPSGAQLFFVLSCSGMKWMYTCDNMLLFSIRNGPHNTRVLFFTSSLHLNVCNCQACQRFPFLYSSSYKKKTDHFETNYTCPKLHNDVKFQTTQYLSCTTLINFTVTLVGQIFHLLSYLFFFHYRFEKSNVM